MIVLALVAALLLPQDPVATDAAADADMAATLAALEAEAAAATASSAEAVDARCVVVRGLVLDLMEVHAQARESAADLDAAARLLGAIRVQDAGEGALGVLRLALMGMAQDQRAQVDRANRLALEVAQSYGAGC